MMLAKLAAGKRSGIKATTTTKPIVFMLKELASDS
jgi:hypothetical protein